MPQLPTFTAASQEIRQVRAPSPGLRHLTLIVRAGGLLSGSCGAGGGLRWRRQILCWHRGGPRPQAGQGLGWPRQHPAARGGWPPSRARIGNGFWQGHPLSKLRLQPPSASGWGGPRLSEGKTSNMHADGGQITRYRYSADAILLTGPPAFSAVQWSLRPNDRPAAPQPILPGPRRIPPARRGSRRLHGNLLMHGVGRADTP